MRQKRREVRSVAHDLTAENWMNESVVLLNVTYEALEEISADRAMILVLGGDAEVVEVREPEFLIRSQFLTFQLPRVIRMTRYVMVRHHVVILDEHSRTTFRAILERDKYQCAYCGNYGNTVDHIVPKSRGGKETWGNLITACAPCNNWKANRTPEEAAMELLWPPKVPRYDQKLQKQIWKSLSSLDEGGRAAG